jgi:hypothetical protein
MENLMIRLQCNQAILLCLDSLMTPFRYRVSTAPGTNGSTTYLLPNQDTTQYHLVPPSLASPWSRSLASSQILSPLPISSSSYSFLSLHLSLTSLLLSNLHVWVWQAGGAASMLGRCGAVMRECPMHHGWEAASEQLILPGHTV